MDWVKTLIFESLVTRGTHSYVCRIVRDPTSRLRKFDCFINGKLVHTERNSSMAKARMELLVETLP